MYGAVRIGDGGRGKNMQSAIVGMNPLRVRAHRFLEGIAGWRRIGALGAEVVTVFMGAVLQGAWFCTWWVAVPRSSRSSVSIDAAMVRLVVMVFDADGAEALNDSDGTRDIGFGIGCERHHMASFHDCVTICSLCRCCPEPNSLAANRLTGPLAFASSPTNR
jgi:hypothetical protein